MKGHTICPNCKNKFSVDVSDEKSKSTVQCPSCNHEFFIKIDKNMLKNEECTWEEHGEPRKTILSAIRPKTNKPNIAIVLLICVFALGLSTSIFPSVFIESTSDIFSNAGVQGNLELYVTNIDNESISNVNVSFNGYTRETNQEGLVYFKNISLGLTNLTLEATGYKDYSYKLIVFPFFNSYYSIKMSEGSGMETKNLEIIGCSSVLVIFSTFALISMVVCLKRRNFDVAIAGSLIAVLSVGFFFIGSILSLIAFILIWKSKDEFDDGKKGRVF